MILSVSGDWIILTAGFGAKNFHDAALRVKNDALKLEMTNKVVTVFDEDLKVVCPLTSAKYGNYLESSHHGYGYFAWKAEIVNAAFQGRWGNVSGVIWIDGGCEVNANKFSRARLKYFMKHALRYGAAAFTLGSTDEQYSKSKLIKLFELQGADVSTPQFQATWFLLAGEIGRTISDEWLRISLMDISYLDFSNEGKNESDNFIEHRFDQSIFSMVLKSFGIPPLARYVPVDGRSLKSQFRGFLHPIWTSRNRYGKTIKKWKFH